MVDAETREEDIFCMVALEKSFGRFLHEEKVRVPEWVENFVLDFGVPRKIQKAFSTGVTYGFPSDGQFENCRTPRELESTSLWNE